MQFCIGTTAKIDAVDLVKQAEDLGASHFGVGEGPLLFSDVFRVWDFGLFPVVREFAALKDSSLKLAVVEAVHFPEPAFVTISMRGPVEPSAVKEVLTMRISAI